MKVINEHIKTQSFKPVYLLYGEEKYLVRQFRDKLKKAMLAEGDSMNVSEYEGKDINVKEIIDVAETLPFFAERRIIVIENSTMFKSSNEAMADYIKQVPETTSIIFVEDVVDKRNKLFKAVKEYGYISEMEFQSEKVLFRWIDNQFDEKGKYIDIDAKECLLTQAGTQMELLEMEIEKLVSYTGERECITVSDVKAITVVVVANKIFEMVQAVANKNQQKALDMYYDLLTLKEAPMRILFLLAKHFNSLMLIKGMQREYCDQVTMCKTTGLPSFVIGKYKAQCELFTQGQLRRAVKDCVEIEERIKTGALDDKMGVELIIVKYSN